MGEFHYGGDASVSRPEAGADVEAFYRYVHERENPAGPHKEWWHHTAGCRRWITIHRDTRTHRIMTISADTQTSKDMCSGTVK